MAKYTKVTEAEMKKRIQIGMFSSITGTRRAIGKSHLPQAAKDRLYEFADKWWKENGDKAVSKDMTTEERLRIWLQSGKYESYTNFCKAASKVKGKKKKEDLLKDGEAYFKKSNGKAKKNGNSHNGTNGHAVKVRKRGIACFTKGKPYEVLFVECSRKVEVLDLLRGAADKGHTLPSLIETMELVQ